LRIFLDRQDKVHRRAVHRKDGRSDLDDFLLYLELLGIDIFSYHEQTLLEEIQQLSDDENVRIEDALSDERSLVLFERIYFDVE